MCTLKGEIPLTEVSGSFNYFLHRHQCHQLENPTNCRWLDSIGLGNSTHGSGWIGSGPFYTPVPEAPSNPTHGSGWILQLLRPKDLKHPPTAVGGIFGVFVQRRRDDKAN
jgi:hypothetical protein